MESSENKGFRFSLYLNQHMAMELGLENVNQAMVFDLLANASSWAKPEIVDGEVYYWVARSHICQQLPFLKMKPDTVYRHFKKIHSLGLTDYIKVGKKDCIRITDLGRTYLEMNPNHYVGNKSELCANHYVGNKSESDSEINPTYKTNNTTDKTLPNNQDQQAKKSKSEPAKQSLLVKETMLQECFKTEFKRLLTDNEINPTATIWKLTTGSFVDYWMQGTTAKYKKLDWLAVWRNWIRSDIRTNGWRYRKDQQVQGNSIMSANDLDLPLDDNLLESWAKKHKAPLPIAAADYTYQKYRSDLKNWIKKNSEVAQS